MRCFEPFFARPAISRGGLDLFTNAGPLAGALRLEDCHPSAMNPWLVQEYVEGTDVCSFSIVYDGRVTGHAAYVHPRQIEHSGGIVFESIDDPDTLSVARTIAERMAYHGQLSFDFKRTERGLVLIECNPRPTAGVLMMTPRMFVDALFDRAAATVQLAAPGTRMKISSALIRDMLLHWREARADFAELLSDARDVYAVPGDRVPALFHILSYSHVLGYRWEGRRVARRRTALIAGYLHDICWNGESRSADVGG